MSKLKPANWFRRQLAAARADHDTLPKWLRDTKIRPALLDCTERHGHKHDCNCG